MARRRIRLETKSCRRCGRQVMGINRPIHASQATYDKWNGICDECISEEENNDMLHEIAANIMDKAAK